MSRPLVLASLWLVLAAAPGAGRAAGGDPDGVAFFEARIRPVLATECAECHAAGAKTLRGGLRTDSRAGLLAGGDSGPAVVPGRPDESLILAALRHEGPAMPPRKKLADSVIADFERWINLGAPDPRDAPPPAAATTGAPDLEAGRRFWAYQPPAPRAVPGGLADAAWPLSPIDAFVLAELEARGMRPGPEADRATLLRRLRFDLTGLPPTPEEIDAFLADTAPDAYARQVERLLGSPAFGERFARRWLDVARFGESLTLRGFVLKDAWRYRDYVIDAFNADLPFDEFVRDQIAGDLRGDADLATRRRRLAAAQFLVLGNTNLEEQDKAQLDMDVVDEQIDVIGKAFLAQTIACARCHDHKFDPIPTRDYYALAGILRGVRTMDHANVSRWIDRPLPLDAMTEAVLSEYDGRIAAVEATLKAERGDAPTGVLAPGAVRGIVVDDAQARRVGEWKLSRHAGTYIGEGYLHDLDAGKGTKTLTFTPETLPPGRYEVLLAYTPGGNRAADVPATVFSADGETTIHVNQTAPPPIRGRFASLGTYRFEPNGQGFVIVSNEATHGHVIADAVVFLPAAGADGAAGGKPDNDTADDGASRRAALEEALKGLKARRPRRETVMGVVEEPRAEDLRIHVRGSVHTLGDPVPRGFLRVALAGSPPVFAPRESGRRELADWLAAAENPLTARVAVNRVWGWLLGEGLVRTVDNFGTTGEPPSHPALLDWLVLRFVADGWSVKALVRRIVLSRTYRLAAIGDPAVAALDPENRWLGRANRRRLDAECLRDAMRSVAGRLDRRMGGASFPADLAADFGFHDTGDRRAVYVPVFRNALPELFEVFDFPNPSLPAGRRETSTIAPQALWMLNSPEVIACSRQAAARLLAEPHDGQPARIDRAFRLALGRGPTDAERAAVAAGLHDAGTDRRDLRDAWALVFQALFALPDYRRLD